MNQPGHYFGDGGYAGSHNAPIAESAFHEYPQRAETFVEEMYVGSGMHPIKVELPLFQYIALASVAFGVENRYEIILAGASHVVYKFTGNEGLAAIYSTLAGIQIQKKRYKTAALATLLDVYDTLNDINRGKMVTKKGAQKLAWWGVGYMAAMLRYV